MTRTLLASAALMASLSVAAVRGQTPAAAGSAQEPPAAAQPVESPQRTYSYDPAGRRDPFLSLLGRGDDPVAAAARPAGVSGLLIGEVTVKGTLRDHSGFLALLQSPDNRTYMVRTGARLLDGTVKSIDLEKVIFSQDVTDPLSPVRQREVPKAVRRTEGRGTRPVS